MTNLELYRVFYTVAKCGSLSRAAQELFISQPATSQAIKQLESQLGTTLFNRTHKGMELSAAGGKLIYGQVRDALELLDDAEQKLLALNSTAEGTLRIGATDSIFAHIIADKIAEFNKRLPQVKLELISSTSPYTVNQLKEGRCDIAFVNLPLDDDERFCGTITRLNDVFVAGDRFKDLKGKKLDLKSLQELPVLMIEENTVFRRELKKFTESLGIRLNPDIEVANWDFMLKLAKKGMGVGCIPREYCLEELESGELFELDTTPSLPVRGVGIAVAKNVRLTYVMKEFISMFERI